MGQEEGIFMKNFIVIFGLLLLILFFISVGIGMVVEKNNDIDEDEGEIMFTEEPTMILISTLPFGLALCSFGFFVEQIIHLIF